VYASNLLKFLIVNNTNTDLDPTINQNLIVNNHPLQPFELINATTNLLKLSRFHSSGLSFDSISPSANITMLYNDSAIFSVPYLLNTVTNFQSRLDNTPIINASITLFPNVDCLSNLFDTGSFTSELMFGFTILLPSITFAVEAVHDKEVLKYIFNFKRFIKLVFVV
jgi:hypothetical protein